MRERGREREREGGREGEREGGREGEGERGREGGREGEGESEVISEKGRQTEEVRETRGHLRDLILGHCVQHPIPNSIPVHYDPLRQTPIVLGSEVVTMVMNNNESCDGHVTRPGGISGVLL